MTLLFQKLIKDRFVKLESHQFCNENIFDDIYIFEQYNVDVYYDCVEKKYLVKYLCGECGCDVWMCYESGDDDRIAFNAMTWDLDPGIVCKDCYDFNPCEYECSSGGYCGGV